jgi:hypothetical protein
MLQNFVALTGYNNATKRRNLVNQTDVIYATWTVHFSKAATSDKHRKRF